MNGVEEAFSDVSEKVSLIDEEIERIGASDRGLCTATGSDYAAVDRDFLCRHRSYGHSLADHVFEKQMICNITNMLNFITPIIHM